MFFKRTLVLSSIGSSSEKAVLNIEKNKDMLEGSVRLYNFKNEPVGILSLALVSDGKVSKAGLSKKEKMLYSFQIENNINLRNFSCALVNVAGGKTQPLMMGSTDGNTCSARDASLASSFELLDKSKVTVYEAEKSLDKNNIDFDDEEKKEIEKQIDFELGKDKDNCYDKCKSCKYREAFFGNQLVRAKEEEVMKPIQSKKKFYEEIKPQLGGLFEKYEPEIYLEKIIPSSKWVKVDYENDGHYYVVGLIYEGDEIKFVCYGVPGIYSSEKPKELDGFCQWLPLDDAKPYEMGYWLMYQNAETGENEKVEIV